MTTNDPGGARGESVSTVKARLSELVRAAERGEPTVITRHGRAVAALVGAEELRQLQRLRASGPEGGLASVAGGWEDSDRLADRLDRSSRTGWRDVATLD